MPILKDNYTTLQKEEFKLIKRDSPSHKKLQNLKLDYCNKKE